MTSTTILGGLTEVWDVILTWITGAISDVQIVFYSAETGYSFLGVLAVISVAIGLIFLLIGVIQNFLHFRS